jgi:uncharacterized protein
MTRSKVFFADLRASVKENLLAKFMRLVESAGIEEIISPRDLVAVKLHFGEKGNTAIIRPVFVRKIVDRVLQLNASPFLTDANTLYVGTRSDSVSHIHTAIENGFAYSVVKAPIIIADGMKGTSCSKVQIDQQMVKTAYLGREIVESDALISMAHFKGHELSGFGGTIKNLGMGCASRRGKLDQHSVLAPKVKGKKCQGCGDCLLHCAQRAITLREKKAVIDPDQCVGCGECILVCPNGAIEIQWDKDVAAFQKKMVEYTLAVLKGKERKAIFINFLMSISPACDCYGHCDAPIVHDIGIAVSKDPVAIDQASADLVNGRMAAEGSCLKTCTASGEDKFRGLYPQIDWNVQLDHAVRIGLGMREYELVTL